MSCRKVTTALDVKGHLRGCSENHPRSELLSAHILSLSSMGAKALMGICRMKPGGIHATSLSLVSETVILQTWEK